MYFVKGKKKKKKRSCFGLMIIRGSPSTFNTSLVYIQIRSFAMVSEEKKKNVLLHTKLAFYKNCCTSVTHMFAGFVR